jgi:hypothetical protein
MEDPKGGLKTNRPIGPTLFYGGINILHFIPPYKLKNKNLKFTKCKVTQVPNTKALIEKFKNI